jgi:hypothetical protein
LVGKSEGNIPLRRPRHRWEDNIMMDLREEGVKHRQERQYFNHHP